MWGIRNLTLMSKDGSVSNGRDLQQSQSNGQRGVSVFQCKKRCITNRVSIEPTASFITETELIFFIDGPALFSSSPCEAYKSFKWA